MWRGLLGWVGCMAVACSGDSTSGLDTSPFDDTGATDPGPGGGTDTRPPEEEGFGLIERPAQTDRYVFVANPQRDTLTRVRVDDLQVVTTPVGRSPEIVLTTADFTSAVVLNRVDDSVSIVDVETLATTTVPVRPDLDQMVLSPTGGHAVLWHDASRDGPGPGGLQSFNEASFVDVRARVHYPMAVGFNPRAVRFTPDGTLAVVVSDAALATIDLTVTPLRPRLIELEPDQLRAPAAEEVILAADGSFAWVRQFGATSLLIVDLDTGTVDRVAAGDNPTDLDLSHDGLQAIAVARDSRELWIYDATDPFAPPSVLDLPEDSPYGSLLVDPSGRLGVLYTTASPVERFAVWSRADDTFRERPLVKPVSGMAINPTGAALLVVHPLQDGPATTSPFAGSHALTMVALDDLRPNPLLLPGAITGFSDSTDGTWGAFVMADQPYLEVLDYRTLLHEQVRLRSLPEYVGVLPDLTPGDGDSPAAWASQVHPLGRISFYDRDSASLDTLTGFELNSDIDGN